MNVYLDLQIFQKSGGRGLDLFWKKLKIKAHFFYQLPKSDWVADPPQWNSNAKQNPAICDPPLYITVTFEPSIEFKK